MKFALSVACVALVVGAQGVHAEVPVQTPPDVAAFLASPTHCSVLIGGADREGDGADRTYAESMNKALNALGGSPPSAAERMRSACVNQSAQSVGSAKAAP